MKLKIILTKIFEEILGELNRMSESDFSKLEDGDYSISVKIVKNKSQTESAIQLSELQKSEVLKKLEECKTREEGYEVLSNNIMNKKELELMARFLEISILKQDKIEQIRDKIIEATVGAILRSNAIQGKVNNRL
jgi:hypothetical protein